MEAAVSERDPIRLRIEKRIEAFLKGYRQNVGLVGPSGFGKSHLLGEIFHSLIVHPELLVIRVDASSLNFDQFVEKWVGSLLAGLLLNCSVKPPQDFQHLLREASVVIPKTTEKIQNLKKMIRKGENCGACVRELFALNGVLARETGRKIILLIDEFQKLENLPVSDPFAVLGKAIMVEKETLYLVTSSRPEKARDIFRDRLSLLFGNFEVIEIPALGYEELGKFLKDYVSQFVFTSNQKHSLLHMTDGVPVYLRIILDRMLQSSIFRQMPSAGHNDTMQQVSNGHLVQAFCHELLDYRGRLALIFEKRLQICQRFGKDSAAYLHILLSISDGRRKVLGIASYIGRKVSETKKMLDRLVAEEVIIKRGSFYMIEDSLFRFWLREVYQKKSHRYYPDEHQAKQDLEWALQQSFEKINQEAKLDITARVESLFKEFRNELVEINQRRWRFPQFSELAFRPTNGRFFPLYAKSSSGRWVCQIASEVVHEEDVVLFLDELKKYRKPVQRRILIPLAGIDQNAKLMAQEAKIQLWDLHNFNSLLDLYNLPKVIFGKESHETNMGAVAESLHTA